MNKSLIIFNQLHPVALSPEHIIVVIVVDRLTDRKWSRNDRSPPWPTPIGAVCMCVSDLFHRIQLQSSRHTRPPILFVMILMVPRPSYVYLYIYIYHGRRWHIGLRPDKNLYRRNSRARTEVDGCGGGAWSMRPPH